MGPLEGKLLALLSSHFTAGWVPMLSAPGRSMWQLGYPAALTAWVGPQWVSTPRSVTEAGLAFPPAGQVHEVITDSECRLRMTTGLFSYLLDKLSVNFHLCRKTQALGRE